MRSFAFFFASHLMSTYAVLLDSPYFSDCFTSPGVQVDAATCGRVYTRVDIVVICTIGWAGATRTTATRSLPWPGTTSRCSVPQGSGSRRYSWFHSRTRHRRCRWCPYQQLACRRTLAMATCVASCGSGRHRDGIMTRLQSRVSACLVCMHVHARACVYLCFCSCASHMDGLLFEPAP